MDRRFLRLVGCLVIAALSCTALLSAGCGKEGDSAPATSAAGPSQTEGGGESGPSHTHRPVIVGPGTSSVEFPDEVVEGNLTRPPHDYHPTGETPRSVFVPSGTEPPATASPTESVEPTFSATSSPEFNPLRIGVGGQDDPNPLRAFPPVPRMSAPPEGASEFVPFSSSESSPATASAAPPAAADPEFHPMAIDPAADVRATGPAAPSSAPESVAATTSPFEVVQVFYGTDRAAIDPAAGGWMAIALKFLPTGFCVLVTLCLLLIAVSKRSTALWVVTALGVGTCIGLGYQAANSTLIAIRWEGKQGPQYTIDRAADGKVQLGVCEVSIPKMHNAGGLESPSILRLEVREDAAQHVILTKTEPLAGEPFYELLRQRVKDSPRKELFVFIHGFDTQFEDAARRTAQIHYDLKFQGAPIFFSWPANNKSILTYPADENTIGWTTPHLKQFLLEIVKQSDAQSINLIAHSMGNRALSTALREIELEFRGQSRLFNQVVLAAPDIDADEFRTNIAPAMQRTANHVTLYASSRDDALRVSQLLHRGPRAGDSGRGLVVLAGMDTIDVTAIDTSPWGHIYLGASDPVLQDLKHLFLYGFPPQERRWLSPAQREGLTYWIFEDTQTANRGGLPPR